MLEDGKTSISTQIGIVLFCKLYTFQNLEYLFVRYVLVKTDYRHLSKWWMFNIPRHVYIPTQKTRRPNSSALFHRVTATISTLPPV